MSLKDRILDALAPKPRPGLMNPGITLYGDSIMADQAHRIRKLAPTLLVQDHAVPGDTAANAWRRFPYDTRHTTVVVLEHGTNDRDTGAFPSLPVRRLAGSAAVIAGRSASRRHDGGCAGGAAGSSGDAMKLALATLAALAVLAAQAQEVDPRYAGPPARDADGTISRSTRERARFIRMHPCPSTGQVTGACVGWAVDHIVPIACGGIDSPVNMQWLPLTIKSCAGTQCKDRWERKVYRTAFAC